MLSLPVRWRGGHNEAYFGYKRARLVGCVDAAIVRKKSSIALFSLRSAPKRQSMAEPSCRRHARRRARSESESETGSGVVVAVDHDGNVVVLAALEPNLETVRAPAHSGLDVTMPPSCFSASAISRAALRRSLFRRMIR